MNCFVLGTNHLYKKCIQAVADMCLIIIFKKVTKNLCRVQRVNTIASKTYKYTLNVNCLTKSHFLLIY